MAGAMMTPAGKGGRRPLDAQINLVPFIDLLSCCISFLLLTATWVELARIDIAQRSPKQSGAEPETREVRLTLTLSRDGYTLSRSTGEQQTLPLREGDFDYQGLLALLQRWKRELPNNKDLVVRAEDNVRYDRIVRTMDVALAADFPALSLTAAGGEDS